MKINSVKMPELIIGDLVAKIPIIQGGMGVGVSLSSLASAVGNVGGIGIISTAGVGFDLPEYKINPVQTSIKALKNEIKKAKELTQGIIGVNIMVALSNFSNMVRTSVEAGADIIFSGAGLPLDLPKYVTGDKKPKLVPIISSSRAARLIIKRWTSTYDYLPDGFVVEGPMAGGHLGFKREQINETDYLLEKLIPEVVREVGVFEEKYKRTIPVIAGGGIYTGEDIYKFIELGASGVQMGTRFVPTYECDAAIEFKKAYINCKKEDIVIIDSPVGLPGRAIKNSFIESAEKGMNHPFNCPYHCIKTCKGNNSLYCIAKVLLNAKKGNINSGFVFAGQNAYRVKEIVSVQELIGSLINEYSKAAEKTKPAVIDLQ
ncbi:nitronate monooxygenase family protein [Halocella sp. SP3-1]|uniref:NAD(P)H-dependent flavin oxidoreductase n=1 Tax=Halocella sp. SP3-1 TaxID=2382161 RepID=UPI000F75EC14|nr:nitronate monooxygenase family protein [Halocella sp. SP3-1]AZO96385.1 nitronate monooxygenase [Halocella sp. SP3-1]